MTEPPHIAYVCADRGVPIGGYKGASAHVAELTRALSERGAEVRILGARVEAAQAVAGLSVPVAELRAGRTARAMRQFAFDGASGPRARARASELHGVLVNQVLARELERLHRRWRIDAVYERYSLWSFAAAGFAHEAGVPFLLEVNAPLRDEQRRYRRLENSVLAATLESYLFRFASDVIVPSEELRPYVLDRGVQSRRVHVIPNAADPERFAPNRAARGRDEFVIGFLGSLKPWHGLEFLVRAFRRLHARFDGYRLLIAGDGPLREPLRRSLRLHDLLDATTFCGELAREQVPEVLSRMDAGVAPYPRLQRFYFSPLKVFEYMAAGVPVVASDIGQIGAVLSHGLTGLLHPPGRVGEMVACIEELRGSPELAVRLARNARSLVRRRFTWRRNAERVLALIDRRRGASGPVAAPSVRATERKRVS